MGVELDQGQYHSQISIVTNRLIGKSGNPIGRRYDNPILDSRLYEAEFSDGENMSLAEMQ